MTRKHRFYLAGFALLALVAPVAYQIDRVAQSLPVLEGKLSLAGLAAPATVDFDRLGIPSVDAGNRADAYRILGFLHARDRLFQMDLMRRRSAGRLAEILGAKALPVDRRQRVYQFQRVAEAAVAKLPPGQQAVLAAYTEGVNAHIHGAKEFPPEFRLLRYRPEDWRPADSLLVVLGMFQTLTDQEQEEHMLSVMERLLPPVVTAFLTPDSDEYTHVLVGGDGSRRPARPVPVAAIAQLIAETQGRRLDLASVGTEPVDIGSNNWVVGGAKTIDGRAIVANDMHLPLSVPNIWYRARLRFAGAEVAGISLPGAPAIVVGSNGHVAWGFTNIEGDFLDLVRLELNPANPREFRTAQGWQSFATHTETIAVKDAPPVAIEWNGTPWGPVAADRLLGEPVAVHWNALDPAAVDLGLMELDGAASLEQAMAVLNRAGAPPQNAVLAEERGRIAWTYMGHYPRRAGLDGSVAQSWADGRAGWDGYIPPEELPRLVDPPQGFIATANNRTLGKDYPYVIGHGFGNGYRAHRITEQLQAKPKLTEADLLALQLDTVSGFYEFYRELAKSALADGAGGADPDLADALRAIEQWNGRLDPDSQGIGLLIRWRKDLARAVFAPLVARCVAAEPGFAYQWREQETPLRALLSQRLPATLPNPGPAGWPGFLRGTLKQAAVALKQEHGAASLAELPWGEINRVAIQHPFSRAFPVAARLLDMPALAGGCNSFCVKVLHDVHGAGERMAVSPDHPEDGILHIPGGQSGHPFSPHYRDQQAAWAEGRPLPFLPGRAEHRLSLSPP